MDLIIWALFGAVIGAVGGYLIATTLLEGFAVVATGAFGGIFCSAIGRWAGLFDGTSALGIIMAIIGAVAFVAGYRAIVKMWGRAVPRSGEFQSSSRPPPESIR